MYPKSQNIPPMLNSFKSKSVSSPGLRKSITTSHARSAPMSKIAKMIQRNSQGPTYKMSAGDLAILMKKLEGKTGHKALAIII